MLVKSLVSRTGQALLLGGVLLSAPVMTSAQETHTRELMDIMSGLRTTWQEMEGLSARFTHTFEWILAGERQVTRGQLWLAGRNQFRMQFEDRVMVSDGTTIWDHDKKQNQVLLMNADPSKGIANQQQLFLAYTENVNATWVRQEGQDENRRVVIRIDRGPDADPKMVEITVDPLRMLALRADYTDGAGNNHRYDMEEVEQGVQPEELFTFTIPEGVTVVDMRGGGSE
ncbi:outer membrane lipoprotein carrier protein LolA [Gemmatimonadota bacterium]